MSIVAQRHLVVLLMQLMVGLEGLGLQPIVAARRRTVVQQLVTVKMLLHRMLLWLLLLQLLSQLLLVHLLLSLILQSSLAIQVLRVMALQVQRVQRVLCVLWVRNGLLGPPPCAMPTQPHVQLPENQRLSNR